MKARPAVLIAGPGAPGPVDEDRLRGIRIFDISDITSPKYITNVQTCRGSHTHTVVADPHDHDNVYVYVSGSSGVRPADELAGCVSAGIEDPNSSLFRLEVIKVPLAAPEKAAIVNSPRIFQSLAPPPRNPERDAVSGRAGGPPAAAGATGAAAAPGAGGAEGKAVVVGGAGATGATGATAAAGAAPATGAPVAAAGGRGCARRSTSNADADITVYPDVRTGGRRMQQLRPAARHSRGGVPDSHGRRGRHQHVVLALGHVQQRRQEDPVLDEWGGGAQPRCRATDKLEWGADAIFTIEQNKMVFKSYYKMPAPQTAFENCVAHNGSLVRFPAATFWCRPGIRAASRCSMDGCRHPIGDRATSIAARWTPPSGSWAAAWSASYWYNGYIYGSEIARGVDVFKLVPNKFITQNEIDAAKTVTFDYLNAQEQRKFVWPASFAKARAFLDQLERGNGLAAARIASTRTALADAEKLSGAPRRQALTQLAARLNTNASGAADPAKVRLLSGAVSELATAR